MTTSKPLIALISATPAAIRPAAEAFSAEFPNALVWNLLDDRLLKDATTAGGVTPTLRARMHRLIDHARAEGAVAILLTCSLYGTVGQAVSTAALPVLAPDDAAFELCVTNGYRRILVVASFPAALADAEERLRGFLADHGSTATVSGVIAAAAFDAALRNDDPALLIALENTIRSVSGFDAVLLAQYSLAPVAGRLAQRLGVPVTAGPSSAARALRTLVDGVRADG